MLDPYAIAHLHAVRALASFIRQRWGIWCGVVTAQGASASLGDADAPPPLPACLALERRADSRGSCARSVQRWGLEAGAEEHAPEERTCHGHLSALRVPIVHEAAPIGALYASGWLRAEDDDAPLLLQRRLRALELPVPEAAPPRLTLEERRLLADLLTAASREVSRWLREQAPQARASAPPGRYSEIIGQAPLMRALYRTLDKIRHADSTVLIQGENGTGKELLARAIHAHSGRRDRPFVVQNCSALNDNLLDSELFGHKRGSFTGAIADKPGLFDVADGGTFFLDEVGDMSPTLQVKLLRVLQEGTFLPVGDTVTRKVNVRIIAATHRDLKRMVAEGTFRQDLYYRLNVINLVAPPLRERVEDIPALVEHFIRRAERHLGARPAPPEEDTLRRLAAYAWPGNVRELENEIERLVVLSGDAPTLAPALLSPRILAATGPLPAAPEEDAGEEETGGGDLHAAIERLERRMLLHALRRCAWNKSEAARQLGISRRNLIRKVQHYDLDALREPPEEA